MKNNFLYNKIVQNSALFQILQKIQSILNHSCIVCYLFRWSKIFTKKIDVSESILYHSFSGQTFLKIYSILNNPMTYLSTAVIYLLLIPYSFLPKIKQIPIFQLFPIVLLILFYIQTIKNSQIPLSENKKNIWLLIGWIFFSLISALQTWPFISSLFQTFYFAFTGSLFLCFLLFYSFDEKKMKIIIYLLFYGIFFQAVYSIIIHYTGELPLFTEAWLLTLEQNPEIIKVYNHFSPSSAFGNSSMRASLFISIIPYIIFSRLKIPIKIPLLLTVLWSIWLCDTKGPWICLLGILLYIYLIKNYNKIKIWIHNSNKIIYILIFILIILSIGYLFYSTEFDVKHRMIQLKVASSILSEHFIWGVGIKNYSVYGDQYKYLYEGIIANTQYAYNVADNYFITWIVERGLLLSCISFFLLFKLFKKINILIRTSQRLIFIIPIGISLAILSESFFWDIGHHLTFRFLFVLASFMLYKEKSISV